MFHWVRLALPGRLIRSIQKGNTKREQQTWKKHHQSFQRPLNRIAVSSQTARALCRGPDPLNVVSCSWMRTYRRAHFEVCGAKALLREAGQLHILPGELMVTPLDVTKLCTSA